MDRSIDRSFPILFLRSDFTKANVPVSTHASVALFKTHSCKNENKHEA